MAGELTWNKPEEGKPALTGKLHSKNLNIDDLGGFIGAAGFATIYGTMFAWMSTSGAFAAFIAGWLYDVTGSYRAGLLFSMATVMIAVSPFWTSRPLSRSRD